MLSRSTAEVFADHLRLRAEGDLATDLERNYADDVVLLCRQGVFRGRDAVRESAEQLGLELPGARFAYVSRQAHGEYAFLEWRGIARRARG